MCGIVGIAGELEPKSDKILKTLLILDQLRGEDSTGVAAVARNSDEVLVAKQLGTPIELFEHRSYSNTVTGRQNRVVIGHNRYATMGGVSRRSAHPFEFDTLVGVHNGTLHNKHVLADQLDFKVDSENLYHHIEKHGLEDAMKIVRGAWALVWWDKVNSTINFLRNKERTLYFTVDDSGKRLYWASEAWMLEVALSRNDTKFAQVQLFTEDMLHTVEVAKGGKLGKPVLRKIECAPPVPVVTYQRDYGGNWKQGQYNNFQKGATQPGSSSPSPKQKADTKVVALPSPSKAKVDHRSKLDVAFMRAKQETFEAVVAMRETTGAEYVLCFCTSKPFYECRLYTHRTHAVNQSIGCEFIADIGGFVQTESGQIGYYKISPHSVKIVSPGDEQPEEGQYLGHQGNYLSKKEWEEQYGNCSFCSDVVEAEDMVSKGARLTKNGDCLCGGCLSDPEIKQYVNTVEAK